MLYNGMGLVHNNELKMVAAYSAQWSLKLTKYPHIVLIKFEGETTYTKFISDNEGNFSDLEVA